MILMGLADIPQDLGWIVTDDNNDNPPESAVNPGDASLESHSGVVRILIAEDNDTTRKTVCSLLSSEPGFEVVSEAANGLDAIRLAAVLQPDIVLLDITMPTLGGIEASVRIRRVAPATRIIFLTQHNLGKLAEAAMATGAQGYVLKSSAGNDLLPAIRAVVEGKVFVSKMKP